MNRGDGSCCDFILPQGGTHHDDGGIYTRMTQPFYRKFIGNAAFYKAVLAVTIPILLQNGITNFVSMLDNIMVGRVGTQQMSAVAIANQLFFVFNLCVFGVTAGAGIFTTQYYGRGDVEGMRSTIRFKLIAVGIFCVAGIAVFLLFGENLIALYLKGQGVKGDAEATLHYARSYMLIMLIGIVAFSITQVYAGTLRETGDTLLPMKCGFTAVAINLAFNYVLIYGKLGFPKLGVDGAAIATVLSRFVEAFLIIFMTHRKKEKYPFFTGIYRSLRIPKTLVKYIMVKGMPLLVNEALWALGTAILAQCFSVRGLIVVAAYNISSTIFNVFMVVALSLGNAIAIMVGHQLGARRHDDAMDTARKLMFFAVVSCAVCGAIMAALAGPFANIYNTTAEIKDMAKSFIIIVAICFPIIAFVNACYFTLRSGGKTLLTCAFDGGYVWGIAVPLVYILTNATALPVVVIFAICQYSEITKAVAGYILVKKGVWLYTIPNRT